MSETETAPAPESEIPSKCEESDSYTFFSGRDRTLISYACSISAVFSTLSSFIYFPAITALATSLKVSVQSINFTITSYQLVSGITPLIFGDMADEMGRRPVIIITFTLYIAANIGLALQSNYPALVALRCLQSAGASSTIAIAYGIIADISVPETRGSYVGTLLGFTNSAPMLGPVIGGAVAEKLSWRWIFWLLAIVSGLHFVCLLVFLPETSRKLVGNGGVEPPMLNRSLYAILCRPKDRQKLKRSNTALASPALPNPFRCLVALLQPGNFTVILVGSIQYAVFGCLATSLSTQMIGIYGLNYLTAGLVYLPAGFGGIVAAFGTGKLLDYDYRMVSRRTGHRSQDNNEFPIEESRLRSVFPVLVVSSVSTAGYGWALYSRTSIAAPLVVQFFSGASQVFVFVTCGTLLTDFNPGKSATVQASYNLIRCALSAGGIAALEALEDNIGLGWCFTVFAVLGATCIPIFIVLKSYGPKWRATDKD